VRQVSERTKAIDALVKAALEKGEEKIVDALAAARLGASSETIDALLEDWVIYNGIEPGIEEIIKLGASQTAIDNLAVRHLNEDLEIAVEIAKLGASQKVKDSIMRKLVQDSIGDADYDPKYLSELARKLYGETPVPGDVINPLIEREIKGGWVHEAAVLANLRKQPLTTEEIQRLTKVLQEKQ